MPRTDRNGRRLESVLAYLADRPIGAKDMQEALDVVRNTYVRRREADDYPNAEELRLVARAFAVDYCELMVTFGLVDTDELLRYAAAAAGEQPPRLRDMKPRTKERPT